MVDLGLTVEGFFFFLMVLGVGFWKSFGVTKIEEKSVKESRKEEAEDDQLTNLLNQRMVG